MERGDLFFFLFFIFVILSLILYWFFPFQDMEFKISKSENYNFTLNSSVSEDIQFHKNMRYKDSKISYRIEKCTLKKTSDILQAMEIIKEKTILDFYPVEKNEEIWITCDENVKFEGNFFVAGEGGPTKIIQSKNFNVIYEGAITLLRDSKCAEPVVALHELLHALGFDHSQNPENIMYPISRCNQKLGQDIQERINYLYSFPSYPDLAIENASALMHGRYLDISVTIKNYGLQDTNESKLIIYADNKKLKEILVDPIQIGGGRVITLTNILVLQTKIDNLQIFLEPNLFELDINNNKLALEVN
ncbi:MAG: matrixin family metalloprotease [Candidatus Pacearchaeota archaeon]